MVKLIYFGKITEDGGLNITNKGGFLSDLKAFAGKAIRITIEAKAKRSNPQNAFYWGNFIQCQIDCFKERWGETYRKEQMHEWNKANFWGTEHIIEETGEVVKMPCSSTVYNKTEWEEKLENIRQWFRQNMDWEIGHPNEQAELTY